MKGRGGGKGRRRETEREALFMIVASLLDFVVRSVLLINRRFATDPQGSLSAERPRAQYSPLRSLWLRS